MGKIHAAEDDKSEEIKMSKDKNCSMNMLKEKSKGSKDDSLGLKINVLESLKEWILVWEQNEIQWV